MRLISDGAAIANTTADNNDLSDFRLEEGEQLSRASCLVVCERFFAKDLREATAAASAAASDQSAAASTQAISLSAEQRSSLLAATHKLCDKLRAEHDTLADPIRLEIRSVPVSMYAHALRHYYLRVEDVLEVHPGVKHRLALAWWHNTTVTEPDVHEKTLRLCGRCCDELLHYTWQRSERFNIIWNNCDQMLNRCEQSFVIALMLVNTLWFALFCDYVGFVLFLLCSLVLLLLRRRENTRVYRDHECDRLYVCPHVRDRIAKPTPSPPSPQPIPPSD